MNQVFDSHKVAELPGKLGSLMDFLLVRVDF